MPAHAVVKRGAARGEALRLGVINSRNQPHELTGNIAMEPGWPESALRDQPTRRKDDEVDVVYTRCIADRLQDQEDGRVGVVVADRADGIEMPQVVAIRRVAAVPGHH